MCHPRIVVTAFFAACLLLVGISKSHSADDQKVPAPPVLAEDDKEVMAKFVQMASELKREISSRSQALRELRERNPFLEFDESREVLKRLDSARGRLLIRARELDGEFQSLASASKNNADPRAVVLMIRRTTANRNGTPEDVKNVSPAEFVKLYEESVRLERQQVQYQLDEVDKTYSIVTENNRRRDLVGLQEREKDLRAELEHAKKMLEPIEDLQRRLKLKPLEDTKK